MAAHYTSKEYDPHLEDESAHTISQKLYSLIRPAALRWKAGLINRFIKTPGNLLDAGAGAGAFIYAMQKRGWKTTGIEKSTDTAEYGQRKYGVNIYAGDLSDAVLKKPAYDVISFWHSLEHIHRLKENLQTVKEILKQKGLLIIALPNPDSLDAKIYKAKWVAWDAPRHLWHFKPDVMRRLLDEMGFKLLKKKAMPFDPFYNCLHSEFLSGSKLWKFIVRFPIISFLSYLLGTINPARGSSIVYIAVKR